MEDSKSTLWTKGIIISMLLIIFDLTCYLTGQIMNMKLTLGGTLLIYMIGVVISTIMFSKQQKGQATFGNLFAHGFKIAVIVALIIILWHFLMTKVIFPDLPAQMEQHMREFLLKNGVTEQQITERFANSKKHEVVYTIAQIIITYGIFGAISALIGAACSKRVRAHSSPFDQ